MPDISSFKHILREIILKPRAEQIQQVLHVLSTFHTLSHVHQQSDQSLQEDKNVSDSTINLFRLHNSRIESSFGASETLAQRAKESHVKPFETVSPSVEQMMNHHTTVPRELQHLQKHEKGIPELTLARLEMQGITPPSRQEYKEHPNLKLSLWETLEQAIAKTFEPTLIKPYTTSELAKQFGFESLERNAVSAVRVKWIIASIGGEIQGLMGPQYLNGKEIPHTVLTNNEKSPYFSGSATLLTIGEKIYVIRMTDFSGHYDTGSKTILVGRELFAKNSFALATINDIFDQQTSVQALWNVRVTARRETIRTKFDLLPAEVEGVKIPFSAFGAGEYDTTMMQDTTTLEGTRTSFTVGSFDVSLAPEHPYMTAQQQARQAFINNELIFS